jgi:hypothetical protein
MSTTTEAGLLLDHLTAQRLHILGILDGLDDAALRRPVLPSGWTCLGLVRHLTLDVEKFWFLAVAAGDPEAIAELEQLGDGAWQVDDTLSGPEVLARYRLACEQSDAVVNATPLDAAPAWWPADLFGDWRIDSLRELLLHVITETACHAGHLDAARELLDGRQWLILTDTPR